MRHGPNHLEVIKPNGAETSEPRVESAPEQIKPVRAEKPASPAEIKPDAIEHIRANIANEALGRDKEAARLTETEQEATPPTSMTLNKDIRTQSLNRVLKHVREHLPAPERVLSRIIHKPVVDVASELGSKTVARPSGIIGGGICAFLGSTIYLYYAKHIGFRYNFLVFGVLFVGGFAVGLVLEIVIWLVRRPWRS